MRSNLRRGAATWTLAAILFSSPAIAGVIDTPLPILPATMKAGKSSSIRAVCAPLATLQVAVHCTNFDDESAQVGVEFFGFVGDPQNDVAAETECSTSSRAAPGRQPLLSPRSSSRMRSSRSAVNSARAPCA